MSRLSFCFGVLLIGLILGHAASGQAGTGAAFYNPPASLSVAVPSRDRSEGPEHQRYLSVV